VPTEVARAVDRVLDKRARKHAGIVVGVRRDGETTVAARGRVADDRPQPPDERTIFEIGSITKVFTATLLADLAREGLVALDDPVQRHLPEGVVMPVRGRPITLADLASHTSGLPRLPKGLFRRALRERANPYASFTVEDLHAAISVTRPRRPPGRKVRYSNYGAGLLGHVLALRAGTSYEQLVAERITQPLGMTDTSITVSGEKLSRFAQGHSFRGREILESLP
jgi:serine-type D-Ala-D-Ala carboxypeptidase/endopeptidase